MEYYATIILKLVAKLLKKSKVIVFLLLYVIVLNANTIDDIYFNNIDKKKGLSSNYVNQVIRDNQGFIWIATNDGLCRYETHDRFKIYRTAKEKPNNIQSNNIRTIYSDSKDNLWIGTRGGGLTRLHQPSSTWTTFKNDINDSSTISNNEILSILEDKKGRIWIGTENGLNLFNSNSDTFFSFKIDNQDPKALQSKAILTIYEDQQGWIWVGTWAGGLHLLVNQEQDIYKSYFRNFCPNKNLASHNIWTMVQSSPKSYWVGSHGDGLFNMLLPENASNSSSQQDWIPIFKKYPLHSKNYDSYDINDIKDIYQEETGAIWVATNDGLYCNDFSTKVDPTDKNSLYQFRRFAHDNSNSHSLQNNTVNDIYRDEQGLIWMATSGGISMFSPYTNQFSQFQTSAIFGDTPLSNAIYVDTLGIAWIISKDNGLVKYNLEKNEHQVIFKKDHPFIKDTRKLTSSDNQFLLAGSRKGIGVIDMKDFSTNYYPFDKSINISKNKLNIRAIYRDNEARIIWVGTEVGLVVLDEKSGKSYKYEHKPESHLSISDNSINSIAKDNRGNLWISTYNGLNRLNSNPTIHNLVFERFHKDALDEKHKAPNNRFTALKVDGDKIYIGTTDGLCVYNYDCNCFVNYSGNSHKLWVQSIEVNTEGNLWISTTENLLKFDVKENQFKVFEEDDGLANINFILNKSFSDKFQNFYFVNEEGIAHFKSEKMITNIMPPAVAIKEIKILDENGEAWMDINLKDQIKLDYGTYYLSIYYATSNYDRIEKNQFAYRLKGFEERWNYTNKSIATYTNLDPGIYTFEVKAVNNDGVWSTNPQILTIEKCPAFWQTTWFKIANILGLIILFLIGSRWYNKALSKRNLLLKGYNQNLSAEIQERKNVEIALQEKSDFINQLMNSMPQNICWINQEKQFMGANTAFFDLFDIANESELSNFSTDQFTSPVLLKRDYFNAALIDQLFLSKKSVLGNINEYKSNKKENNSYWFKQDYIPLKNKNEEVIGAIISSTDITRLREVEKQLRIYNNQLVQSNKELEQFAYIASHDLRSPLTTLISFTRILKKKLADKLDPKEMELMDFISDGAANMQELVNAILEFSRINNQDTKHQPLSPSRLLTGLKLEMNADIKSSNATIILGEMPDTILGDRIKIKQVLQNLIANGIKFTKKGVLPIIEIKCETLKDYWQFEVKDNGIGINKEFNDKIFKLFQRLHTAAQYEGTGIGLSLCKKIIKQHGGDIWVESKEGEGSTFYFTIKQKPIQKNIQYLSEVESQIIAGSTMQ